MVGWGLKVGVGNWVVMSSYPATVKLNERQIKEFAELKRSQEAVSGVWGSG